VTDQPLEPLETIERAESAEADSARSDEDALAKVTAERDEYLALAQRVQADFENYRKRAVRDQERLVGHAHERLIKELLPVLDDLGRALEAAEPHEESAKPTVRGSGPVEGVRGNREVPPTDTSLIDGLKLVEKSLRKALEKEGLAEIATEGPFDPHVHEALATQPGDGADSGSVLEVVQRGYRLGDKVVRPARVIVAE
jgi:molecular chaperone GrpE